MKTMREKNIFITFIWHRNFLLPRENKITFFSSSRNKVPFFVLIQSWNISTKTFYFFSSLQNLKAQKCLYHTKQRKNEWENKTEKKMVKDGNFSLSQKTLVTLFSIIIIHFTFCVRTRRNKRSNSTLKADESDNFKRMFLLL
jgi:hypothetical protein